MRFECEHSNTAITTTSHLYIPDQTHASGSLIPRPHITHMGESLGTRLCVMYNMTAMRIDPK